MVFTLLLCTAAAFGISFDYSKQWKEIDALLGKGLPVSADARIDSLLAAAYSDGIVEQQIKGLVYKLTILQKKEEFSTQKAIDTVRLRLESARFPSSAILHSMLAQLYWSYYQSNRYLFSNRTQTTNFQRDDIATWDLATIAEETIKAYRLSLQRPQDLQTISIWDYPAIINKGGADEKQLRPTLYDFLAWRALDFYVNDESGLTRPPDEFKLDKSGYFSSASSFAAMSIDSPDSLSLNYLAVNLFQDLIGFHLADSDPAARMEANLDRLSFVYRKSSLADKASLYEKALRLLLQDYSANPASALASYRLALLYQSLAASFKTELSEEHRWDLKTAAEICQDAMKRFPSSYGARACRALYNTLNSRELSISGEDLVIPNTPVKVLVSYKNISRLEIRIYRIPYKDIQDRYTSEIWDWQNDKKTKLYSQLRKKALWKQSFDLLDEGDYRTHRYELALAKLPAGHYIMIAADGDLDRIEGKVLGFSLFSCTSISNITPHSENNTIHLANRDSGWPISGAQVRVYGDDNNNRQSVLAWSGSSDVDGMVRVEGDRGLWNKKMEISTGADTLQIWSYSSSNPENSARLSGQCLLFTDRAIYRPGQTIHVKGVVYYTDGEKRTALAPQSDVTLSFKDVNYQQIDSQKLKANEYGCFATSFIAPTGVLTGNMSIQAFFTIKTNRDETGIEGLGGSSSTSISVEQYKRPRFEVKLDQPTQTYALNQSVDLKGKAVAYSGVPIDNSAYSYRIYRQAQFPYWYWWWGPRPSSPEKEVASGTGSTDAMGEFSLSFIASADAEALPAYNPYFTYRITVDVTDLNGETRSGALSLNVGMNELILGVELAAQIDIQADGLKLPIQTSNLNGAPIAAKGKLTVSRLQAPDHIQKSRLWSAPDRNYLSREDFVKAFPNDPYFTEDRINTWPVLEKVWTSDFSTPERGDVSVENLSRWQPGAYVLEAIASHKGKEVKVLRYFTVYDSRSKDLPYPQTDWLVPVKTVCQPGETAKVLFGSSYAKVRLRYEVEKNHALAQSEILVLNSEQRLFEVPVTEADRGGFYIHFTFIKDGRAYLSSQEISVPWTNKQLSIEYQSFRDKLLPGNQEEWRLKLKDHTGGRVTAEVLASMYDASLDAFRSSTWTANIWKKIPKTSGWHSGNFVNRADLYLVQYHNLDAYIPPRSFDSFNWYGYSLHYSRNWGVKMAADKVSVGSSREIISDSLSEPSVSDMANVVSLQTAVAPPVSSPKPVDLAQVAARSNFAETAFFYPTLRTDANGEVSFVFTVPDALTRWKFRAFALSSDLSIGLTETSAVTQKPLMVQPNLPRFFREGDRISVSAKISALEDKDLKGKCQLFLLDAFTGKPIGKLFSLTKAQKSFKVGKGQSTVLSWELRVPEGLGAVTCRIVAKSGTFSDGEEVLLPILSNRMLVTESLPLPVRGKTQRDFRFAKLIASSASQSIRHHRLTLEYTSNPSWYAVQALPYLMEYPHECNEQIFSRLYANSLASHIANSDPAIKRVFESWGETPASTTLLSNLQKNEELKAVILQETPWVMDAKDETSAKQRLGMLFELNNLKAQEASALAQLQKNQSGSGAWSWFAGMPDSWWVTQYIVEGFGHLDRLGVKSVRNDNGLWTMLSKAVGYIDDQLNESYQWLKAHGLLDQDNLGYMAVHYLYARSFFPDLPIPSYAQEAVSYYWSQAEKYWLQRDFYSQGMLCLALYRKDKLQTANDIIASLREHSLSDEEMGMWWKANSGWYWYQAPIERQAILIEAFSEVAKDTLTVNEMRTWLLKNKQTNNWKTTKATAQACYALLLEGTAWLGSSQLAEITVGHSKLDPSPKNGSWHEAGTGYFKTSWLGSDIKPAMGEVSVSNPNPGPSWGALYWQYFEDLDKITPAETPLKLTKQLFIERTTDRGLVLDPIRDNNRIKVGDKVVVRIELRVDREMEYLHMKDLRASGFEPLNVLSRYKWQDGLGYYEATGDAATNFFIERLPKGTYVFEYGMRAFQKGDFSNGITSIQCMYAPEFTAHSEGIRIKIE